MNTLNPRHITEVLIVDDSAVIRGMMSRIIEADPGIKVVASAQNGEVAIKQYKAHKPDVVIMDIEMPVMNGLEALAAIIKDDPAARVIMCSTLSRENAEISMKAMEMGAVDYIPKPTSTTELNSSSGFQERIIQLIRSFGKTRLRASGGTPPSQTSPVAAPASSHTSSPASSSASRPLKTSGFVLPGANASFELRPAPPPLWRPRILAVGSSTGGPQALFEFFRPLKGIKTIPIVITQHMPATFTALLAQHITQQTGLDCVEAAEGTPLLPGRAHIAKGGLHMLVKKNDLGQPVLTLNDGAPENFCKPAVDPMLRSLLPLYGRDILTVILTGMGSDGMLGAKSVVDAGGYIMAQDQASSVVWGMPGAVAMAGLCSAVLPITEIGAHVAKRVL